jgi:large subunit ribosomal protein L24
MKLHINDQVQVIAGKDKGKKGKITKVFPAKNKVIVEGINKYKRHLKRQSKENPGGIVEIERPIWSNNLMVLCPTCKKTTRIGHNGVGAEKTRICKKCQSPISVK